MKFSSGLQSLHRSLSKEQLPFLISKDCAKPQGLQKTPEPSKVFDAGNAQRGRRSLLFAAFSPFACQMPEEPPWKPAHEPSLWCILLVNFLPANRFSMKPLKVKLLAGEQKATELCRLQRKSRTLQWNNLFPRALKTKLVQGPPKQLYGRIILGQLYWLEERGGVRCGSRRQVHGARWFGQSGAMHVGNGTTTVANPLVSEGNARGDQQFFGVALVRIEHVLKYDVCFGT